MIFLKKIIPFLMMIPMFSLAAESISPNSITLYIDNFMLRTKIQHDNSFAADVDFQDFMVDFNGKIEKNGDFYLINVNVERMQLNRRQNIKTIVKLVNMNDPIVIGGLTKYFFVKNENGDVIKETTNSSVSIMLNEE